MLGGGIMDLNRGEGSPHRLSLRSVDDPGATIPRWQVAMLTVRAAENGENVEDSKRPILTNSLQRKLFQEQFERALPKRNTDRAMGPARPFYTEREQDEITLNPYDGFDPFTIPPFAVPLLFMLMTLLSLLAVGASVAITAYGLSSPAF